jgi:two-component system, NtrC family, nitrogen regulation response regulator NtrX
MTDVLPRAVRPTPPPPRSAGSEPVIVAESVAMRRAVELARRFAPTMLPVLIVGETGTGKEVLAQAIHRWSGRRGRLVDVDCGALPQGMVVAEFFGHRRGAFTTAVDSMPGLLEQAGGGTLFLDELSSLPSEGQAALLRVLETREVRRVGDRTTQFVDIRLLSALQDLSGPRTGRGRLRDDLLHRMAGSVIHLPPLRTRPEDLIPLARFLATQFGVQLGERIEPLLERHAWPGNVRELRHVIARAASLSGQLVVEADAIAEAIEMGQVLNERQIAIPSSDGALLMARCELRELCREHGGQADLIAEALGVSRATLYRRLRDAGISLRDMVGPR